MQNEDWWKGIKVGLYKKEIVKWDILYVLLKKYNCLDVSLVMLLKKNYGKKRENKSLFPKGYAFSRLKKIGEFTDNKNKEESSCLDNSMNFKWLFSKL